MFSYPKINSFQFSRHTLHSLRLLSSLRDYCARTSHAHQQRLLIVSIRALQLPFDKKYANHFANGRIRGQLAAALLVWLQLLYFHKLSAGTGLFTVSYTLLRFSGTDVLLSDLSGLIYSQVVFSISPSHPRVIVAVIASHLRGGRLRAHSRGSFSFRVISVAGSARARRRIIDKAYRRSVVYRKSQRSVH